MKTYNRVIGKIIAFIMIAAVLIFAPAGKNRQSAGSVAALGAVKYKAGEYISSDDHVPEYLRLSQAERELKEKESR